MKDNLDSLKDMLSQQEQGIPQVWSLKDKSCLITTHSASCPDLYIIMDNFFFNVSFQQNAALEMNGRKIQECERRIRQLTEELDSRNQKLEVRLHLFVIYFIVSKSGYLADPVPSCYFVSDLNLRRFVILRNWRRKPKRLKEQTG